MVEETEGCDINQGKYAKQTQVHKIRETNFVDLHFKEIMNHWIFTIFLHENGKVGRVTFFLKKRFYCIIPFKNFKRIKLHSFQKARISERKFDNVARVATTIFHSIASIREVVVVSLGAKGLRLHERLRT
jgi:hypothetical protein